MQVFICCLTWLPEGDFLTILIYDYVVGTIQDSATTCQRHLLQADDVAVCSHFTS